jgi:hypothetical protein
MSIPIPSGVQPDLVFYYNVAVDNVISSTDLGTSSLIQTRSTPLYSDKELTNKIGTFGSSNIFPNIVSADVQGLYPVIAPNVYFLPQGSIEVANNVPRIKNPATGNYTNPPGTYVYGIDSGYGDYLNTTGIVVLIAAASSRQVLVYFNK